MKRNTPLNSVFLCFTISIFVSSSLCAIYPDSSSQEGIVESENEEREIPPPFQGIPVLSWDAPADQGWIKSFPQPDGTVIHDPALTFRVANHVVEDSSVGIAGSAEDYVYGSWESPGSETAYTPGSLYSIRYTIRTTQSDPFRAPNCRLFTEFLAEGNKLVVGGGSRVGKGPFAPDADGETYNVYLAPPDLSGMGQIDLKVRFELIDFSSVEEGTNYLEEVQVERFPVPEKSEGILLKSYATPQEFGDWKPVILGSPYGPVTLGLDGSGLFITTPGPMTNPTYNLGFWTLPHEASPVSFEPGKLYRAVYTLSVPTEADRSTVGKLRMFNQNWGGEWGGILNLVPDHLRNHMPTTGGSEYSVFFESMPKLYTGSESWKNRMNASFEIQDGRADQWGTVYLNKLDIYEYEIP